ncbi:MAG TPA: PilZ domain-containing protein [Solirubrobacteraceae bacterium]|nr:PilZ domain-containing protein [Solirubrobacteraceae bacterium]
MTPGRGQHAKVTLPEAGTFPAVVDMTPGHATAMLLARPLHPLDGKVGAEVGIDITTKRGLLHIDAQLVEVPSGEVLELGLTGEEQLIQRRSFARVDALIEVVVTPAATGEQIPAAIVNISACGAVVSRLSAIEPGEEVRLSLQLAPYEPPLQIVGRVVREHDDEFRAVQFEQIQEADRERIIRFVFDRQRLERREGRM